MDYEKAGRKVTVGVLSGLVILGPFAEDGCKKFFGYSDARCQDVGDAAQNLHKWFIGTSTATIFL